MLKWLSGEEGESGAKGPGSPHGAAAAAAAAAGDVAVEEMAERLSQTEQLVTQLKEMIREKDATLRAKDDQLKVDKEACEAKLSKLRLQNKAKVTSLSNQLEELRKQQGGQGTPTHSKKGSSEGGEQASRGKIVLLKKKVEELEQQVAQRDEELGSQRKMLESQRQRGEEMDAMLTEKDRKLAEKEAYIVHLQIALAGDQPLAPAPQHKVAEDAGAMAELQLLVQSLTRKVGEAEERYSLLQEKMDSLRELLTTEKEQYSQKETMYQQNIQTFKDIILQKDNQLTEVSHMHEQELFRLAAKSDASADLEQLLKALKQKLHEKEEVLLGKTQVIDVLQEEVDGRDQQIKELTDRLHRLQVERESLESKMEAEKHVMRAQLRDLIQKQQAEVQRLTEQHQAQVTQLQQDLLGQMEELRKSSAARHAEPAVGLTLTDSASIQRIAELEALTKQKSDEASRSEAKFLKMKAWSKSRIRQLEEELKKSQAGAAPPDLTALRSRVTALEEEREENLWKVEQYEELKTKNEMLEAKLVLYEEQQRTLQADLEQFTKRAASQASESGSADDAQSQVLEWQEMVAEAVSARDRAREEKAAMVLRISHMDEEREAPAPGMGAATQSSFPSVLCMQAPPPLQQRLAVAPAASLTIASAGLSCRRHSSRRLSRALATRQQELEEELAQHRAKKLAVPSQRSLQDDFEFDGHAPFQDLHSTSESTTPMEGENMGGWWPEFSSPDTGGLRSVVEELELERNQLQEQILSLEERCQDLEDRLQLQARIETLQNESEKLQSQLSSVRSQQSRDAEKHQLLVKSLNEQLKGLSDTQESLESSLIEKENTLAKTSEKLQLISSLRETLSDKENRYKEVSEKLVQAEHTLENVSKKYSSSEKQCSELKTEVADLLQKLNVLKERTQKQEVIIETLQTELDQTNEELDKLNTTHLEERAQLIHDLQSCEREIDGLKDIVLEKDKEISSLSGNMAEYAEQVTVLKQEIRVKEEQLVQVECALSKAEQEAVVLRDSQTLDQQALNAKITELLGKLQDKEAELVKSKEDRDSKATEVETLIRQVEGNKKTIQDLRGEIQKQIVSHRNHLSECETHIMSLKEQLTLSTQKLQESGLVSQLKDKLQQQLDDKEQMYETERKTFKDEQNKLVSQMEKYKQDIEMLSKRLEEQLQTEQHITTEKLETIASLEKQLNATEKQAEADRQKYNSELQEWDSRNQRLSSDIQSKSESISELRNILKGLKTENQQLQHKLKGLNEELKQQKHNVKELKDELVSAQQINSSLEKQLHSLTQENQTLELTVTQVKADKETLLAMMEGLQKNNEELNKDLEHSSRSHSNILLAKTDECSRLGQLLGDREDTATRLQEQVQRLTSELHRLQLSAADEEQAAARLRLQVEDLQQSLCHLQQQECSLKATVTEKQEDASAQRKLVSKLQAEAELLRGECSQLRRQVEDKDQLLHKHKDELDETNRTIKSLSDQVSATEDNMRRLESEADLGRIKLLSLTEENQQLRTACESREKQLAQETQLVSQLHSQLEAALEQGSAFSVLTADNHRLQEELALNIQSLSEVTIERRSLQDKTSDHQKTIEGLKKTNEELTSAADELKQILQETEMSSSASLLEKTSECANLSNRLREREEQLQTIQEQLNMSLNDKEQTASQLLQLHDTISMLQEQGSVLKLALMEKDAMLQQRAEQCSVHQNELAMHRDLVARMQAERLEATKQMEQKEQMLREVTDQFQSHKDELSKRNESVLSLSRQLGAMNDGAAATEAEMSALKAAVQSLGAEKSQLRQEVEQSQAQLIDFKDCVQALNEQNAKFKSELQKMVAGLVTAQEDVSNLNATLADLQHQLKATAEEKESLHLTVHRKDEAMRQRESLVLQLSSSVAELDEQLKQKVQHNVSLSTKMCELDDCVSKLRSQVDSLTAESFALRDALEKNQEDQSRSSASLAAKEEECENLKEQISHLEESLSKVNGTLQVQAAEVETLRKALEEKDVALFNQSRSLQDAQRRADEALLFKSHFTESTELVSQLQSESENLRSSARETQSAFNSLQEKYAANLEELRDVKKQLSQQSHEQLAALTTIQTLSSDLAAVSQKLKEAEEQNLRLSQEKEEALASHQASVSSLTVELERLKAQHLQVVAQMDALTDNLEQREMALHAINSQYTAQAKHASQLVSEIQTLKEQNERLSRELGLSRDEHQGQLGTVRRLQAEKEELEQQNRALQQTVSEKETLGAKVSAKDEELCELRKNIQKVEQILQDSEKEWLSVLDREKQHKHLLAEQLRSVENQMKAKDLKVDALQQDLDGLQEKLAEASSAIRQRSDELRAKEVEASASRTQLEKVLASVQEKDGENSSLQQTMRTVQLDLLRLVNGADVAASPPASLQDLLKQLEETHRSEVDAMKNELHDMVARLQQTQNALDDRDRNNSQQLALLQDTVEQLKVERDRGKEAAGEHASLLERMGCMDIQISQQKELLAGLSQQLRDRDTSIAQVMEAASNERMKLLEENLALKAQLESTEQTRAASTRQLEERQTEADTKDSEKLELIKRNDELDAELAKLCKEKEVLKKKLQVALILRKDLQKQIEQREEQVEELTRQAAEKQGQLLELQVRVETLQTALSEKEARLYELSQTLDEKNAEIQQLQSLCAQERDTLERERDELLQKLESQKDELGGESSLESQLAQLKLEKATMQKKAQAAMLARKETMRKAREQEKKLAQELAQLKDDYKALLEQHCQQTKHLNAIQVNIKELEQCRATKEEVDSLKLLVEKTQAQSLAHIQTEMEVKLKLANKDEALTVAQQEAEALKSQLRMVETELERARVEARETREAATAAELTQEDAGKEQHQAASAQETIHQTSAETQQRLRDYAEALTEDGARNSSASLKRDDENGVEPEEVTKLKTKLSEKEEVIAALESQLQQQIQIHESVLQKMRADADARQTESRSFRDQDEQSKALLTRKLQAALVSRKELKEEVAKLKAKEAELFALGSSVLRLEKLNLDLERSVSFLRAEKEQLLTEVDRIQRENRSLSAACDSLKLTIESITQQKRAFSCQLESLKDSQTEELSKWKSKHAELKQEYESLLQAYENVSSEMDKMRQLLEGARRDRQDALRSMHKYETEIKTLETRETEEDQEKRQQIKELQEENRNIRGEIVELKQQLEASAEGLRLKVNELQAENSQLAQILESKQLKLEEALSLNSSLTARMEAQDTELEAQLQINNFLQTEKENLLDRTETIQKEYEVELQKKEDMIKALRGIITKHNQDTISLTEKVRILEDDKCLLQEELENAQEISDKVKNENEYLETVILKNSERIDELTEAVNVLQSQNAQLAASEDMSQRLRKDREDEQLRLVRGFEQKLKDLQRGSEGSKNVTRELQELLKEKHQEINQLQQTCIKYQEVILDLEGCLKRAESELEQEQRKSYERILALEAKGQRDEAELIAHKKLLQKATDEMVKVQAEMQRLAAQVSQQEMLAKEDEEPAASHRRVEKLKYVKGEESPKLQVNAETSKAERSAPGSTNLWNHLHEKDNRLPKDKDATKSRLERTLNDYAVAAAAQQRQLFVMSASNAELSESVELLAEQAKELRARLESTKQENKALISQLADRDNAIAQMQLSLQLMEKMNVDADAQLLLLQSEKDNIQGDFEKQEGICRQLKTLLQSKDAEISSLLSCKDGQMSGYLEQLQANYGSQAALYEDRLTSLRCQREKADKQLRTLEATVRSLQHKADKGAQEKQQMAAKVELLKKSMAALQSEVERLMSENRTLAAKNQLGSEGSGGSADGEGGAAKGLKHEIRKLLHQMDDLNSENAMLRAQLLRYRDDLNQVLSLKDNQLKVLLKKQQDVIKTLEHQKAATDKQLRESRLELQREEEAGAVARAKLSQLQAQAQALTQKKEQAATDQSKVITDLQEAVADKAAECSRLRQKILSDESLTHRLTEKLHMVENETAAAEEKYKSELDAWEREAELTRSERQVADRHLAELERQLLEARGQSKDAGAQNKALCKAMAALQNDRDQLIQDFKVLRNRYDDELRETRAAFGKAEHSLRDTRSDLAALSTERDVLLQKLKAVESRDAPTELGRLVDELSKALAAKEKELKQVVLENEACGRQLSAFSKSMGSLQDDRDRLMDELVQVKQALGSEEGGLKMQELQQTSPDVPPGEEPSGSQEDITAQRSAREDDTDKETLASEDVLRRLEAERLQLHRDLQRCLYEIQQRDRYFQQLSTKLQQAEEEKAAAAAQLRLVSQTLRDTQTRCHWLESQGSAFAEVAPGAPQERSGISDPATAEAAQLRERLRELELSVTEERGRREAAEEALRVAEDRTRSVCSRDVSINMDVEEEWETLSLNPNQPLISRKVKGGMVTCRRWLRGRSLYFSRLLTSRARSRYFFLAYLLTIHVLVVMCLTGAV